jgi:hypothetical protein
MMLMMREPRAMYIGILDIPVIFLGFTSGVVFCSKNHQNGLVSPPNKELPECLKFFFYWSLPSV